MKCDRCGLEVRPEGGQRSPGQWIHAKSEMYGCQKDGRFTGDLAQVDGSKAVER